MIDAEGHRWIAIGTALYGPGGLFPDVSIREVRERFPVRKTIRSRGGFRVVHVRETDVAAIRQALGRRA